MLSAQLDADAGTKGLQHHDLAWRHVGDVDFRAELLDQKHLHIVDAARMNVTDPVAGKLENNVF